MLLVDLARLKSESLPTRDECTLGILWSSMSVIYDEARLRSRGSEVWNENAWPGEGSRLTPFTRKMSTIFRSAAVPATVKFTLILFLVHILLVTCPYRGSWN